MKLWALYDKPRGDLPPTQAGRTPNSYRIVFFTKEEDAHMALEDHPLKHCMVVKELEVKIKGEK
ncbi:MAG: hypothetical protein KAS32_16005 [Candidatus Peribacteraceae bacterium]|nr:hypothetical protein [Candidatus Peribacteraceae bacterium]